MMIFNKEKKIVLEKLSSLNLKDFELVQKKLFVVPIGCATILLADLKNEEVKKLIERFLLVYPNWKKRILLILLRLNFFSNVKVLFPKNFQLGRFRARAKFFDFHNKTVCTFTNNFEEIKKEIKNRKLIRKTLNSPKIIKKRKDYFFEAFLFPYKNLNNRDILDAFKQLLEFYKKKKQKISLENFLELSENKSNYKKKDPHQLKEYKKEVILTRVHGDIWKGNMVKFKGKIYFLECDGFKDGLLTNDFVYFFRTEYAFSKKINKNLIRKIGKLFLKEFKIENEDLNNHIKLNFFCIETDPNETHTKKFRRFERIFKKVLNDPILEKNFCRKKNFLKTINLGKLSFGGAGEEKNKNET